MNLGPPRALGGPFRPVPAAVNQLVTYCEEILDSRHGPAWEFGGRRDYIRKWRVRVRDRAVGTNTTIQATGVKPFSPYATEDGKEWDYQALCVKLYQEPPEDPQDGTHRIVVAEYSTEMPPGGPVNSTVGMLAGGAESQPWLEPPHIEFDSETIREAPPFDLDGKAYLNYAMQPFKPAPTFEVHRSVMVYSRNEQTHDSRKQARLAGAVNSDVFLGEAPGTVMLAPPRAVLSWRGGTSYWRVTYRFRFNSPEPPTPANQLLAAGTHDPILIAIGAALDAATPLRTWQPRILNAGLMQLQNVWAAGPNFKLPIPIFRNGAPVTEPVLLDENGRELKPVNGVWPNPVYVPFRQHLAVPFTPILVAGIGFPGG